MEEFHADTLKPDYISKKIREIVDTARTYAIDEFSGTYAISLILNEIASLITESKISLDELRTALNEGVEYNNEIDNRDWC